MTVLTRFASARILQSGVETSRLRFPVRWQERHRRAAGQAQLASRAGRQAVRLIDGGAEVLPGRAGGHGAVRAEDEAARRVSQDLAGCFADLRLGSGRKNAL